MQLQSPLGGQLSVGPGSTLVAPSGFLVETGNLRFEATLLDLFGDVVRIGGTGGSPAARAGDAVAGGEITSGSARVLIE